MVKIIVHIPVMPEFSVCAILIDDFKGMQAFLTWMVGENHYLLISYHLHLAWKHIKFSMYQSGNRTKEEKKKQICRKHLPMLNRYIVTAAPTNTRPMLITNPPEV